MKSLMITVCLVVASVFVASAGETVELKAEPCTACAGRGYTERFDRCAACRKRQMEIYATREREVAKELRAAATDPKARISQADVQAKITDADVQSRMPKCATCDAAERVQSICRVCGGRGKVYRLPDGRLMKPADAPESQLSTSLKFGEEIRAARAEIQKLEEQLAKAKEKLAALEAKAGTPAAVPSKDPPRQGSVEVNPKDKPSVEINPAPPRENL